MPATYHRIVDFQYRQGFGVPAKLVSSVASSRPTQVMRISMLRMNVLLLRAGTTTTVLLAGCSGVGGAETSTSNGAGTTPSVDTTPPSTPTGLTGAAAGSTGASLSWSASTDNVGVTAYILLRNSFQVATPATTSFVDTGLSAATTYSYTVAARDAAGNSSPNSTSVSVTTPPLPPSNSPPPPTAAVTAPSLSGS